MIKIGDLVRHSSARGAGRGIVLQLFPHKALYIDVYWFSIKEHGVCPAYDLEVVSESR